MTTTFAELTTMRVGGPAGQFEVATSTGELVDLLRKADAAPDPVLVIGGGSNLIVGDLGFDGTVIKVASTEIDIDGNRVTVAAGHDWDQLVQVTLAEGLGGLEPMSGIPGSVGGTPVQNVGAFGTVTADVLESLTVYDRETGQVERWTAQRCEFASRHSVFKRNPRWVVLDVTYTLDRTDQSRPIMYLDLVKALGGAVGDRAGTTEVRQAVLGIRRGRRMVLDPDDHDTWSVGSFFLNPILREVPEQLKDCPANDDVNGRKLAAGWIIQHSGFPPGYGQDFGNGRVALSSKHALAVTNRGGATTADIMAFAAHIRDGVEARFGIRLAPECDLVNCSF